MSYNKTKHIEYVTKIVSKLEELFDEDSDIQIDQEELLQGENLTHFFHALANTAPHFLYCRFTKQEIDSLSFNHIANTLVVQYNFKIRNFIDFNRNNLVCVSIEDYICERLT